MSFYDLVKRDMAVETAKEDLVITDIGGNPYNVKGLYTDVSNDPDFEASSRHAYNRLSHFTVHSSHLIDQGFDIKTLKGCVVEFGGSKYKITTPINNQTTGQIVCYVKDCE